MEDLSVLKGEVKQKIEAKKVAIERSTQQMVSSSPLKLFSAVSDIAISTSGLISNTKKIRNGFTWMNGAIIGFRIAKEVARRFSSGRKK